ncbi:MAG: flagellar biosynthesis regulator FlaF [Candidatus Eisenbacteria bacterium]|uniref:Flagellar biosynthesis regulator FlaF n=1 Tax=Eiseniibacteriota bacterium TaxID=2212470 RepID=A0A849SM02_UNCEI|nr:flagellar biosynthesis regulator FlaF [Candidatus Eisenbacteria bacterium]
MHANPLDAYETAGKSSRSSRELEATALFKAARQLQDCIANWNATDLRARLSAALNYNQRLWTFFQAELSEPGSVLPAELRAKLLSLSVFVDRRTFELMAKPDPAKLNSLIEINRQVAAGLSQPPTPAGGA